MSPSKPNDRKFEELILFIASRSGSDPHFGSTKLNKLLFFSDFLAYVRLGSAITWQPYQKLPNGPAPRAMLPIMNRMVEERSLAIQERQRFDKTQKVPIALRRADLSCFSPEEVAIVTEVLDILKSKNARGISSLSHRFAGWKLAEDKEDIPYEVALVEFKRPRKKDRQKVLDRRAELAALRTECSRGDAE